VFANNCFIDYLHRKLLTANFLFYGIERAKKNVIYWGIGKNKQDPSYYSKQNSKLYHRAF
jgi:hypothetical protein